MPDLITLSLNLPGVLEVDTIIGTFSTFSWFLSGR